jgi:hypothetical protein
VDLAIFLLLVPREFGRNEARETGQDQLEALSLLTAALEATRGSVVPGGTEDAAEAFILAADNRASLAKRLGSPGDGISDLTLAVAYELRKYSNTAERPGLLSRCLLLATLLRDTGRPSEAAPLLEKVIESRDKTWAPEAAELLAAMRVANA